MNTYSEDDLAECSDEDVVVHDWRREQLQCLGVPKILADSFADNVDWAPDCRSRRPRLPPASRP
jgi:hypothetical protein